jgi:hypothetical protein
MSSNHTWSFESTRHPTIVRTTPANDAQDTAVNLPISATFSEAMDSGTINTSTFTLDDGSTDISGSVSYADLTSTFTPASNLKAATGYVATLTTGIQDLAGNPLAAVFSWTFATAPTTIDSTTGLMWQDNDYTTRHDWDSAVSYCNNLSLAGYDDWYLPSKDKLFGLYLQRTILGSYVVSSIYWSSTTHASYSSRAWYVHFYNGYVSYYPKTYTYYVRCVRAGQ